jgi:hypothetical protein
MNTIRTNSSLKFAILSNDLIGMTATPLNNTNVKEFSEWLCFTGVNFAINDDNSFLVAANSVIVRLAEVTAKKN